MSDTNAVTAGFATRDMTPKTYAKDTIRLEGRFTGVFEPLLARVILLKGAGDPAVLLTGDTTGFHGGFVQRVAQRIEREFKIPAGNVFCVSPENHSVPENFFEVDEDFFKLIEEAFIDGLREAQENMVPVEMALAAATVEQVACSRRWKMRDGSVRTSFEYRFPDLARRDDAWLYEYELEDPLPPKEDIVGPGPVDPEIRLLCLREVNGPICSLIVNYACHVSAAIRSTLYSRDFVGHLETYLSEKMGTEIPVVYIRANGANTNTNDYISDRRDDEDARIIGHRLGEAVLPVFSKLSYSPLTQYHCENIPVQLETRKEFQIGYRNQWEKELQKEVEDAQKQNVNERSMKILQSKLKKAREYKEWIDVYLHLAEQGYLEPFPETGVHDVAVALLSLNNAVLVGYPGEMFVEFGLRLKQESPIHWVFPADDTNYYKSYIGTREAYDEGGYETGMNHWNVVAPGSGERLYDAALDALKRLNSRWVAD